MAAEHDLDTLYPEQIWPFFENQVHHAYWSRADARSIHYAYVIHAEAKGVIVISAGRSESSMKYAELIFDWYQQGYSVFIHDHCGQGQSDSLCKDPQMGFISSFDVYVDDFCLLLDDVLDAILLTAGQSQLSKHLLCHSMGSAIGAMLVLRRPTAFSKVIFCSPMFGISPPVPRWLANLVLQICLGRNRLLGKQCSYFIGQGRYQAITFDKNNLMSSATRYNIFSTLYAHNPQLQLGGVTCEWVYQALIALQTIQDNAHAITPATLILTSGADTIVDNQATLHNAARIPDCQLIQIDGAKHELWFEQDQYRDQAFDAVLRFVQREGN